MARRCGSLSRSFVSAARASLRPSSLPRVSPPPLSAPRPRFSLSSSRNLGALGCTQSLIPLHSSMAVSALPSRFAVSARAFCELSNGTFRRSSQDRYYLRAARST